MMKYHPAIYRWQNRSGIGIDIGAGIGFGVERRRMTFGHEQQDVYQADIEYVGWAFRLCERRFGKHRTGLAGAKLKAIPTPIPIPTAIALQARGAG